MYLATLYVTMDIDPDLYATEREKLLRSLRERVKNTFNHRMTVRTDEDCAIAVAFFDDSYARAKTKMDEVLAAIENAGEARIATEQKQIFRWFEGGFKETHDGYLSFQAEESGENFTSNRSVHPKDNKTIIYNNEDDDFNNKGFRAKARLKVSTRK